MNYKRITKREYEKLDKEYRKTKHGVVDYYDWSLEPHTATEILFRTIKGALDGDGDYPLCFSIVCERSKLSEELIEDLIFIQSGLFGFEWWTNSVVKAVVNMMGMKKEHERYLCLIDMTRNTRLPQKFRERVEQIFEEKQQIIDKMVSLADEIEKKTDIYSRMIVHQATPVLKRIEVVDDSASFEHYLSFDNKRRDAENAFNELTALHRKFLKWSGMLGLKTGTDHERLDWSTIVVCQRLSNEWLDKMKPFHGFSYSKRRDMRIQATNGRRK